LCLWIIVTGFAPLIQESSLIGLNQTRLIDQFSLTWESTPDRHWAPGPRWSNNEQQHQAVFELNLEHVFVA
jgi:hypothetical protein